MPDIIDLHTHTTASDGTLSPAELVALARESGLRAVAITDHDTLDGLPEALETSRRWNYEVIAGVELSVDFRGKAVHMLGYCLDPHDRTLHGKLAWAQEQRETRNARMVARFNELGIPMTLDEVIAESGDGVIGRPHFAAVLLRKKVVASINEAFDIYLNRSGKAYLPKVRFSAAEAITLIRAAGGLPVLAHPMLIGWPPLTLDDAVAELKAAGLIGIEVLYTEHNPAQVQILWDIATRHGLLRTGGSDFHGANKPQTRLGRGRGDLAVPASWLAALLAARPAVTG
ncbi:MAG: PHP domain-containing protein [Myxococcales bacterium]|nr:PHP domain-containing protein [Myxococcales bacterium]